MTKISSFDKVTCRNFQGVALEALKEVAERFGLEVKYAGGKFSPNNFLCKFEFATVGVDGEVNSREVEEFRRHARLFGLNADDLGKKFTSQGKSFIICGLKIKAHKFPVLAKEVGGAGRTFKFAPETIKYYLNSR